MTQEYPTGNKDYYNQDYHNVVHSDHYASDEYFWARAAAAAKLNFRDIPDLSSCTVLEYGCGYGQNIACLPNAVGYDVSHIALDACRHRGIKVCESIAEIPREYFDVVLSRHCLEHLEHPLDNLVLLSKFLKPDGQLVLILPKENHYRPPLAPDVHQHLYCWNFRTVNNLLNRAGYRVLSNQYQSVLGYRALLPIYRQFGLRWYSFATRIIGRLWGVTELVVHAEKDTLVVSATQKVTLSA
jgi:SAM-dependent methyltransferase